jgi:hypothetical protein
MPPTPSRRRHATRTDDFDAAAANREMADKLQHTALRRRARAQGLELRKSAHGYSLVDVARARVGGRNDLTLDEVAVHLDARPGAPLDGRALR